MIQEITRPLTPKFSEKNVELLVDIHPDVADEIYGDPLRLRQILTNLIGNALKFTPAGEVVLRIEPVADDPHRLLFSIRDSGIGIAKDKQKVIFESFSQADNSTTRKYGGTGLGLTISARLVAMMGGELQVDSDAGRGSCFYFPGRCCQARAEASAGRRRWQASRCWWWTTMPPTCVCCPTCCAIWD